MKELAALHSLSAAQLCVTREPVEVSMTLFVSTRTCVWLWLIDLIVVSGLTFDV